MGRRLRLVGLGLIAVLIVLQFITIPLALWLISPGDEIKQLAHNYCSIRIYSAPAVLLTYVAMGWFIGHQDTKIPLVVTITANGINIILD